MTEVSESMRYVCFGYFDKQKMDALPAERIEQILRACGPHMEAFRATGRVIVDAGVETDATILRRTRGQIVATPGPVVADARRIGAVFIIEADTLDDAIRIASLHPTTQLPEAESLGWAIEIHPLHSFVMGP